MERREFLELIGAAAANAAILGLASPTFAAPGYPLPNSGGSPDKSKKGKLLLSLSDPNPRNSVLRVLDWDTLGHQDFVIPLSNPHSMILDGKDPDVGYFFESFGSCAKVHLRSGEAVSIDHTNSGTMFSGHGVQSRSGEYLLCTERDRKLHSIVSFRSAKTLQRLEVAPKECNLTHQLVHLPGSSLVACGNLGPAAGSAAKGAITFFDYEKRQVVNRVAFDYPILHLVPLSSTEALGVSQVVQWNGSRKTDYYSDSSLKNTSTFFKDAVFSPGPICYAKTDGSAKLYWDEKQPNLFLENFAVAKLPEPRMFLSSHRQSGKVLLWKDSEIVHQFDVPGATHLLVAKNGEEFLVRSDEYFLKIFSLKSLENVASVSEPGRKILTVGAY